MFFQWSVWMEIYSIDFDGKTMSFKVNKKQILWWLGKRHSCCVLVIGNNSTTRSCRWFLFLWEEKFMVGWINPNYILEVIYSMKLNDQFKVFLPLFSVKMWQFCYVFAWEPASLRFFYMKFWCILHRIKTILNWKLVYYCLLPS